MADVASPTHGQHHRHTSSIGSMTAGASVGPEPVFEMVPNPTFSFPMLPRASDPTTAPASSNPQRRRHLSVQLGVPSTGTPRTAAHSRATSALPSFSFNAADATGLQDASTPPETPTESTPATPNKRGHKRRGSEFVGGDSRLGVDNAISTSPTKTDAAPMTLPSTTLSTLPPSNRRTHRRDRSYVSTHDASEMMTPPSEVEPRTSSSLPTTPSGHHGDMPSLLTGYPFSSESNTTAGADRDVSPVRPTSRPGRSVGFAREVEIIPRPLSTISSGSESSKGHSLSSSIDMISMSPGSPSRNTRKSLDVHSPMDSIDESSRLRSSSEIGREQNEQEGQWLKSRASSATIDNVTPMTESTSPALTFVEPTVADAQTMSHRMKRSSGDGLGFDRRRSEPAMASKSADMSRLSALSLQEDAVEEQQYMGDSELDRKSSTRKIKDWALAKLHRRSRDFNQKPGSPYASGARPRSEGAIHEIIPPNLEEDPVPAPPMAETDLDTVFDATSDGVDTNSSHDTTRVAFYTPTFEPTAMSRLESSDNTMIDLDAAFGAVRTSPMIGNSHRKTLHSARTGGGPTAYLHRRAESAPMLTPFDFSRHSTTSSAMADVFEEEEEEDSNDGISPGTHSGATQVSGMGILAGDADHAAANGLRISRGSWTPDRPSTSHGNMSFGSRLSTPANDRRTSSIIEDRIVEESIPADVPVEPVQIVEDYEEPRASSLTKSSDSSETPTLLAVASETETSIMTPDTYQTSTFSSPDLQRRQGSFEASRVGTSASSIADTRTTSSGMTGEHSHDIRASVDDVPSLTSSRSTMLSTAHANTSRRDFGADQRTPSASSTNLAQGAAADRRRKRSSVASFSQLMSQSFGAKAKASEEFRPATAGAAIKPKKEHRLKKLMFWRSKSAGAVLTGSGKPYSG
ncbi:hypothetical protein B0A48_04390 [Cryoendolithus antarcticus]|uniref:Cell wall proline rich protein n=1 Tax=Cryoendolithus antarcticus TaxID=1507870 RepID=A0A1V8TFH5_9PEZI|nr:hypothetical protein B0A48_04390 [Cryoendolithus antarcticus]